MLVYISRKGKTTKRYPCDGSTLAGALNGDEYARVSKGELIPVIRNNRFTILDLTSHLREGQTIELRTLKGWTLTTPESMNFMERLRLEFEAQDSAGFTE